MRPAPAWIGWAALAAAATGCCRMQPPSAVDSLESTWTKLREGGGKPAATPKPAPEPVGGTPAGPAPAPVVADGYPERPRPIPLVVPPARGESPGKSDEPVGLRAEGAPASRPDRPDSLPLQVGGTSPAAPRGPSAVPLRVGSAGGDSGAVSGQPLPIGSAGSPGLAPGRAPGLPALAPGVAAAPVGGALPLPEARSPALGEPLPVRRESFLPPLRNLMVPPVPGAPALPASPAASSGVAPVAPAVPMTVPPADAVSGGTPRLPGVRAPGGSVPAAPPSPPVVGKEPVLLGASVGREPAPAVPSRALDRAASGDPDREAARRAREAAALREREAEAGVLRQFLRRVLRLEPAPAPAAPEAVSEPAR